MVSPFCETWEFSTLEIKSKEARRKKTYPDHFAPLFKTSITLASRRFRVSSCFAPEIEFAISFLCVKANSLPAPLRFPAPSTALLLQFQGTSTVRCASSRSSQRRRYLSWLRTPAPWHKVLFTGIT